MDRGCSQQLILSFPSGALKKEKKKKKKKKNEELCPQATHLIVRKGRTDGQIHFNSPLRLKSEDKKDICILIFVSQYIK